MKPHGLCVPKTLSALISRRNHLTSVDHVRTVLFRPDSAAVIDLSLLCLRIVRRAFNLYYALGFALRRFFLSLSLFFLSPCLRCTVAISALHAVIRLES